MSLLKTVESLAKGAATTAYSVARHPVTTVAVTAGFVKGAAEAGVGLVRTTVTGQTSQPVTEETGPAPSVTPTESEVTTTESDLPEPGAAADVPEPDERDLPGPDLPGPDLVETPVPVADDLPEPVVIEADDSPDPTLHESFHHEPHATTRADTIGHEAGDVFEAEDEADEALAEVSEPQP